MAFLPQNYFSSDLSLEKSKAKQNLVDKIKGLKGIVLIMKFIIVSYVVRTVKSNAWALYRSHKQSL